MSTHSCYFGGDNESVRASELWDRGDRDMVSSLDTANEAGARILQIPDGSTPASLNDSLAETVSK
jgi:hypothetical protein